MAVAMLRLPRTERYAGEGELLFVPAKHVPILAEHGGNVNNASGSERLLFSAWPVSERAQDLFPSWPVRSDLGIPARFTASDQSGRAEGTAKDGEKLPVLANPARRKR